MWNREDAGKGPAPHEVCLILGIIASNAAGVGRYLSVPANGYNYSNPLAQSVQCSFEV